MAPIQPYASVSATGLGIRYVGEYAYAASGKVACNNTGATLLEFTSAVGVLTVNIEMFNWGDVSTNADMAFLFSLNDQDVGYVRLGSAIEHYRNPVILLVPPLTKFKAFGQNVSGGTEANSLAVTLSGRVYGVEE
jgi:hypothetical protein